MRRRHLRRQLAVSSVSSTGPATHKTRPIPATPALLASPAPRMRLSLRSRARHVTTATGALSTIGVHRACARARIERVHRRARAKYRWDATRKVGAASTNLDPTARHARTTTLARNRILAWMAAVKASLSPARHRTRASSTMAAIRRRDSASSSRWRMARRVLEGHARAEHVSKPALRRCLPMAERRRSRGVRDKGRAPTRRADAVADSKLPPRTRADGLRWR